MGYFNAKKYIPTSHMNSVRSGTGNYEESLVYDISFSQL